MIFKGLGKEKKKKRNAVHCNKVLRVFERETKQYHHRSFITLKMGNEEGFIQHFLPSHMEGLLL